MKKKRRKKNVPKTSEKKVSKRIVEKENRQLIWFFVLIIVMFAAFLGPYFYLETQKKFDIYSISWTIEKNKDLKIFHGQFPAFNKVGVTHNLYHRNDPRDNEVIVEGKLDSFYSKGYFSFDKDTYSCKGEVSRITVELGVFMLDGVGLKELDVATSDINFSKEQNVSFLDCQNSPKRSVVMIKLGNESKIVQSSINEACYELTIQDCEDVSTIERFMVQSVDDLMARYG